MKKILLFVCTALLLVSCNSEPTLQKYFVDNTESKDFIAIDLAPSMLNVETMNLTAEQELALKSFQKVNILAFQVSDSTKELYGKENDKVKLILKDPKYQELMHFGSGKDGGSISYVGDESHIEEFVIYANKKENGFAVVRVIGKDMNPNSIMTLMSVLKDSKMDLKQLAPLQKMFSNNL